MHVVDKTQSGRHPNEGRYSKGIQRLKPELVASISKVLKEDPTISKSALAKRVGVSRQTVLYYLRRMSQEVEEAAERTQEFREERVLDYFAVLERVATATDQIGAVIDGLTREPTSPATTSALVKAHNVLARHLRLAGDLIGAGRR